MTLKPRYFTKSLFALACKCPTKLYYTNKQDEYLNTKLENNFLKALTKGGLQVAALAKQYYPEGKEIESLNYPEALAETNNYLQKEKVVLFEAAIRHQNLFIRADIIVKDGDCIELIEVKAKSYDSNKPEDFLTKKGDLSAKWAPYLQDIAFQKYVFEKAFPHFKVNSYLLLADKRAKCPNTVRLRTKQQEEQQKKSVTEVE